MTKQKWIYILIFAVIILSTFVTKEFIINDTTIMNQSEAKNQGNKEINSEVSFSDTNEAKEPKIGVNVWDKAPNFTFIDTNGNPNQLSDYKGKKVLLNFWTSWCKYCNAEMQDLIKFHQDNQDTNIVILSVNVTTQEKAEQDALNYIKKNGLKFAVILDKEAELTQMFRVQGYPTNFFIDQNGIIRQRILGGISLEDIHVILSSMN